MSNKTNKNEQEKKTSNNEAAEPHGHFDKFVNDIVRREEEVRKRHEEYVEAHKENPQLQRNRLYRELPQNRTRWSK